MIKSDISNLVDRTGENRFNNIVFLSFIYTENIDKNLKIYIN